LNTKDLRDLPIGTSADNQEIADLARESREAASAEDRLTLLDILLERTMSITAIEDPTELLTALNGLENFVKTFKGAVANQAVNA
jgi:hypothetical protein